MLFIAGVSIALLFQFALASHVNVTIDDKFGDSQTGTQITYLPPGAWHDGEQPCSKCIAHLDPSQLHNGTWHDSTFNPQPGSNDDPNQVLSASVTFNGSALYVYCVIAHSSSSPDGHSDMIFSIDNEVVGTFAQAPTTGHHPTYQYRVPVYVNHSMPAGIHTFTLQNGRMGGQKSLVLLDSIMYTQHTDGEVRYTSSTSASATRARRAVLLGSLLGTLLGLLFVGLGLYLYIKFRRRQRHMAPSQQYAADENTARWFRGGRASMKLQTFLSRSTSNQKPEMASVRSPTPSKIMRYPQTIRGLFASAGRPSAGQREPTPTSGEMNFVIVNQ